MSSWRKPSTAPRDGTIIIGLFERPNKRSIALLASFDSVEHRRLLADPAPDGSPQWVKDGEQTSLEQYRSDPSYGFGPEGDNHNDIIGRMVGWRPRP